MIATVAIITSIISLAVAAYSLLLVKKLKAELESVRDDAFSLRRHVNVSLDILKKDIIDGVSKEMKRQSGQVTFFHKDMSIGEALQLHPLAKTVMSGFHLGGCSSCDIKEDHILGDATQDYGIDLDNLLEALNGLLDGTTVLPEEETHQIKIVNMLKEKQS